MQTFQYGVYKIGTTLTTQQAKKLCDITISKDYEVVETYKDEAHSLVEKIKFQNIDYILKIPRGRNNGFLERLRSLFRKSYAERTVDSHFQANHLGFKSPKPVIFVEKRVFGICVFSFFVYPYIEGKPGEITDIDLLAPVMLKLYELRIIRGDAKTNNFIINNNEVYLIDFIFRKPIIFKRYFATMEFLRFLEDIPEAINYLPEADRNSLLFNNAIIIKNYRGKLKLFFRRLRLK